MVQPESKISQRVVEEFFCYLGIAPVRSDETGEVVLKDVDGALAEEAIFAGVTIVRASSAAFQKLRRKHGDELILFIESLQGRNFAQDLVTEAIRKQAIFLQSPFAEERAECRESFFVDDTTLVLLFRCRAGQPFIIFQRTSCADAVYFPVQNLVVVLQNISKERVRALAGAFCRNAEALREYARQSAGNTFAGVHAAFNRPYHFFYDIAPAVHEAYERGSIGDIPQFTTFPSECFLSFNDVYALGKPELIFRDHAEANAYLIGNGRFISKLGSAYKRRHMAQARTFDDFLVRRLGENALSHSDVDFISDLAQCQPVLWFGVTSQKRTWREQVDGAVQIISTLFDQHPRLGVIFDGWTSSNSPSAKDIQESRRDDKVVDRIMRKLPGGVRAFSIVGGTSAQKLRCAQLIDYFVANSGTGSIYVSRMMKKPGVAHINTAVNIAAHIHHQTTFVSASDVTDIAPEQAKSAYYVSYSIRPETMLAYILKVMDDDAIGWNA